MDPNQQNPFGAPQNNDASNSNVQPGTNPVPITSVISPNGTDAPKKKSHLGLILGLCIGGVVVAVGAVLLILFLTVWSGPTKQDYADAQKQAQKIADLASDDGKYATELDGIFSNSSSSLTQDQIDQAKSEVQKFQGELKTDMNDLSAMKAIKKGGDETRTKFDALQTAYVSYDKMMTVQAQALEQAGPAIMAIASAVSDMSSMSDPSELSSLASKFNDIGTKLVGIKTDDAKINDAFHKMGDAYGCMGQAFQGSISSDLYSKMSACQDKMSDIDNPFDSSAVSSDLSKTLNDLGQYLTSKANGSK